MRRTKSCRKMSKHIQWTRFKKINKKCSYFTAILYSCKELVLLHARHICWHEFVLTLLCNRLCAPIWRNSTYIITILCWTAHPTKSTKNVLICHKKKPLIKRRRRLFWKWTKSLWGWRALISGHLTWYWYSLVCFGIDTDVQNGAV